MRLLMLSFASGRYRSRFRNSCRPLHGLNSNCDLYPGTKEAVSKLNRGEVRKIITRDRAGRVKWQPSGVKIGLREGGMSYINGTPRNQTVLFPATLDDYLEENNAVRAIDAFIEYLAFDELGFVRGEPAETGRPGYDPRVLLGIFIWGHLNGVRSSRRLEQE